MFFEKKRTRVHKRSDPVGSADPIKSIQGADVDYKRSVLGIRGTYKQTQSDKQWRRALLARWARSVQEIIMGPRLVIILSYYY